MQSDSFDSFGFFGFQNKLIEVVEELRLKRKLEKENESTIEGLLKDKFNLERKLEEQQRIHCHEKRILEENIDNFKKKIEDYCCQNNDDKMKQQHIEKTYNIEIQALKDETRILHTEKLDLAKKNQEMEGKLKLFSSFQETTMSQLNDVRQYVKSVSQSCQELLKSQNDLRENVHHADSMTAKFVISMDQLYQVVSMIKRRNAVLKQEVTSLRTQLAMGSSSYSVQRPTLPAEVVETTRELHDTVALEEMLRLSESENKKIIKNLVESTELLNEYICRIEEYEKLKEEALAEVNRGKDQIKNIKEEFQAKERDWRLMKEMIQVDKHDVETQTEIPLSQGCATDYVKDSPMSGEPAEPLQAYYSLDMSLLESQQKISVASSKIINNTIVSRVAPFYSSPSATPISDYLSSHFHMNMKLCNPTNNDTSSSNITKQYLLEGEEPSLYEKKIFLSRKISETINIIGTFKESKNSYMGKTVNVSSIEKKNSESTEPERMCVDHELSKLIQTGICNEMNFHGNEEVKFRSSSHQSKNEILKG